MIDLSSESSSEDSIKIDTNNFQEVQKPEEIVIASDTSSESDRRSSVSRYPRRHKKRKKKYREKGSQRHKPKYEKVVDNVYFEDTTRDRRNFSVSTLGGSARPRYNLYGAYLGFRASKKSKQQTTRRYFAINIDSVRKGEKQDTRIKRETRVDGNNEAEVFDWGVNSEQEQTDKTREFNEQLAENPDDIDLWIKYISFQVLCFQKLISAPLILTSYDSRNISNGLFLQDVICQFQKDRGITDVRSTLTCQRKLAIANKALEKNPNSTELLKLKLNLTAQLLPADQFSSEVEALLNKDLGNIVLWQALIMATQASVAICTVPKVLELYSRCLSNLRQRLRTNPRQYDVQILGKKRIFHYQFVP